MNRGITHAGRQWGPLTCQQYIQPVQPSLARQAARHCDVLPTRCPAPSTSTC